MIINLTQHTSTDEQRSQGVVDLGGDELLSLKDALTFDSLPDRDEIESRAEYIANLAVFNGLGSGDDDPWPTTAMIGGAPYLMSALESALKAHSIRPVYAFSVRESEEQVQPDGSVIKFNKFNHIGFVGAVTKTNHNRRMR